MVKHKRLRELGESPEQRKSRKEWVRKRRKISSTSSPHRNLSRSPSMNPYAGESEVNWRRRSPSMQTFAGEREGIWRSVLDELKQVNYELKELKNKICTLEKIASNFLEVEEKRGEDEKPKESSNCVLM